jgi:hypothetical protein
MEVREMPKEPTKTEQAAPLSLRLGADMLKKIEEVQDLYITTLNPPGFSTGPVKSVTRAEIVRWALEEGLNSISQRLRPKAGRK